MQLDGGAILWDGEEESGDLLLKCLTELTRESPIPGPTPYRLEAQGKKEYK